LTTSVTVVACVKPALVPATVSEYAPAGVELVVETLNVEEPDPPLIEVGLNVPEAPAGNPLTLRFTAPAKPLSGLTLAV